MTPLLRRAAACAGLAALGLSARSPAQTPTLKPEPIVGGELRRAVPAAPIVQQSPHGLFGLSITDAGIELRGPNGGVRITNAGIEFRGAGIQLGDPTSHLTIRAADMEIRGDGATQLRGDGTVQLKVAGALELHGGGARIS